MNITFQKISSLHPLLASVINDSIGASTPEKVVQVLQGYEQSSQFLIGAFSSEELIAVIGFEFSGMQAIIKHLSVLDLFRGQGVGKALIHSMIRDFAPSKVLLETDAETVDFYKHIGFLCESFEGKYGTRYRCFLDLST